MPALPAFPHLRQRPASFKLRPMLITAVTMVESSGAAVICRTNDWSIFSASIGKLSQIAQAGVARAKIIDGNLYASGPQRFEDVTPRTRRASSERFRSAPVRVISDPAQFR